MVSIAFANLYRGHNKKAASGDRCPFVKEVAWRVSQAEPSSSVSGRLTLGLQRCPGLLSYAGKGRRIRDSQIRKDLPVQGDLGLLEPFHQPVVWQTVHSSSRAYSGYPEAPKIPFSGSTVAVSKT